ncbi:MAG: transglycosylase SLT domain-containing protein [Candidatus Dormibacteraceae bacterium]
MLLFIISGQLAAAAPASSQGTPPAQSGDEQNKLTQIDQQLQLAQASLNQLNAKLTTDQRIETEQQGQLAELARLEYEQPVFSLSQLLGATSLEQLLSDLAQTKLVSLKQAQLLEQASRLRQQEQKTRDELTTQIAKLQAARVDAGKLVGQILGRGAGGVGDQSILGQAGAIACDSSQPSPQSCPAGSIQQIITGAFTPLGAPAVTWGLRIAHCESHYNPRAVNPSGASGLFQFMPSTFAHTPPGKAGGSIWDPVAQSQAASWMYGQGRQAEWECR